MNRMESPLARRLTLADLSGFLVKWLEVPPGRAGLVVDGRGRVRQLPPGRHRVVGLGRRLFGRASDWQFYLLPAGPFPLRLPVPRLRAGDGEWVDVEMLATARLAEPARAAPLLTDPAELGAGLIAALDGPARAAVSHWAAADLNRPEVAAQLSGLLRAPLEAQLAALGLALERLVSVAVRPSDEAVAVARKMAELEAALAGVEMERRMDQLSSQAEWAEFVRQLEADYELPAQTLQAAVEGEPGEEKEAALSARAGRLRQTVRSYVDGHVAALAARVERLLGRRQPPSPPIAYWWERVVVWLKVISAIILIAALAFYLFLPETGTADRLGIAAELACSIPSAVILFISALWLERKAAQDRAVITPGERLLNLGRWDRQRIDEIVRGQLSTELGAIAQKLQETRDRAYRSGQREEAVAIKQAEEQAARLRAEVEAKTTGQAVYLSQAHVTRDELTAMLGYDETLLATVASLADQAEALHQAVVQGQAIGDAAPRFEAALSELQHRFAARARFIQNPGMGKEA